MLFILILIPSKRKQYRHLYNFSGDFLYANSKTSSSNYNVCDRLAIHLVTSTSKVVLLMLLSFSFITCGPVYKNFFTDDREMIIPVILPFIDPETNRGFFINLICQLITSTYGAILVPAIEVVTCILKNAIFTYAVIIEDSLIELKNALELHRNFTDEFAWKFRNIIIKISDFNRF